MEVEKGGGGGGGEEKERRDVEREEVVVEVREVVEEMAGVRGEGVVILVFGTKNDHHQWNRIRVGENHRCLESEVIVHEIVVTYVENHLSGVTLQFTRLIRTYAYYILFNPLLQEFG